MEALNVLSEVGGWSLEALWLPLLIWTAIALPLLCVIRLADSISPHVRYRASLALLASLPLGLAAGALVAFEALEVRKITGLVSLPAIEAVAVASPEAAAIEWSVAHAAGLALSIAAILAIWRLSVLLFAGAQLRAYRRGIPPTTPAWLNEEADRIGRELGLQRKVDVAVAASAAAPLTFGIRTPLVLLPEALLDSPDDLRLALIHELIHVRRFDYLLQWIEQCIGALFFAHPLVALLRDDVTVLREITCDMDVLAYSDSRSRYARLLYQYSTPAFQSMDMALGILPRETHLTKRIRSMKNLLDFNRLDKSKRTGVFVSVVLLAVAMIAVACADLLVHPTSPNAAEQTSEAVVQVDQMPELIGGLASIQVRYPELAKKTGIEGRVIVQFVVDEEGNVVEPTVVRGLGSGLDEAALRAVRAAQFKPGLQEGEPVKVKMSLPITFKLGDGTKPVDGAATPNGNVTDIDAMPEIIGGLAAVQKNLRYPQVARDAGVEGRVIVQFVVDESGEVVEPKVVKGLGSGLDEAALDAVRSVQFTPGKHAGKAVRVQMALPITFALR